MSAPAEEDELPLRRRVVADLTLLRRVAGLLRPHRLRLAGLCAAVLVQGLSTAAVPFLVRDMLDDALPHRDVALLLILAGATVAAALAAAVAGVASTWLAHSTGQRVLHGLRSAMYRTLTGMPLTFFTRSRTAHLQSQVVTDVEGVAGVLTTTASSALQNGALLAATAVALVLLNPWLALISLGGAVLALAVAGRVGKERRRLTRRRQSGFAGLGQLITESLTLPAVLLSRTSGRVGDQRDHFDAESSSLADVQLRMAMAGRWRLSLRGAALVVLPAAVYTAAGLSLAAGNPLSLGTVVAFATTISRVVRPVAALQGAGQGFSGSLELFGRIFEVLDLPGARRAGGTGHRLRPGPGALRVENLSLTYPGSATPALDDVGLDVAPGTTVAVVGSSGAGKSTLAHTLVGVLAPDRGRVLVDDQDLSDVDPDSVPDAVGLVAQDTHLLHASLADNLRFARPDATDDEIADACRQARLDDLVASLPDGYETVLGERGHRFSGGERQRVSLARMLLRDPAVVVLDEATSALDTRTEAAVRDVLARRGRTTVVIAHRLSTVRDADQILVLDHGRVVERGTHDELLARDGRYAALVAATAPTAGSDPDGRHVGAP